jgi:hypothetical protein
LELEQRGFEMIIAWPFAHLSQLSDAANSTPIKLHTASNAINARSKHHCEVAWECQIILHSIVCQEEIVGESRPLSSHSVNLLDAREETKFTASFPHNQLGAGMLIEGFAQQCQ